MLKKQLRPLYREKRLALGASEKMKADDLLLIQFQTVDMPFVQYVLSFYPIEESNEVNTFLITDYLHFRNPNMHLCYPRTDAEAHRMEAVVCVADTIFEANRWNIPEPLGSELAAPGQIDLVLVPLLAFDERGARVGYGKGFYDRYLASCRKDCIKVGFSYFPPVERIGDAGEFDVPLDFCITPQRTYVF